jgi:hypothetical protein
MAKAIHANVKIALTAVNAAEHKYPDVQPDGRQKIAVFSEKPHCEGRKRDAPTRRYSPTRVPKRAPNEGLGDYSCSQVIDCYSGCRRTRTLDPLIKRKQRS